MSNFPLRFCGAHELPSDIATIDREVSSDVVAHAFVEAVVPSANRVVVVCTAIDDAIGRMHVECVMVVWFVDGESEFEDAHAGEVGIFAQFFDGRRDDTQIFSDDFEVG